jgi:rubrerythrin
MAKTMTLSHLFACGIAAENASRDFYLGMAQKFKSQPAISFFWKTMSDDETVHARTLEKTLNSLPADKLDIFVDDAMAQKGQALCQLSISDTNRLDSIHNLDDAFQLAHELESSDINIVFNFLKLKLIPDGEKDLLSSAVIERHLHKLVDFPKMFGDAQMRQRIAVDV